MNVPTRSTFLGRYLVLGTRIYIVPNNSGQNEIQQMLTNSLFTHTRHTTFTCLRWINSNNSNIINIGVSNNSPVQGVDLEWSWHIRHIRHIPRVAAGFISDFVHPEVVPPPINWSTRVQSHQGLTYIYIYTYTHTIPYHTIPLHYITLRYVTLHYITYIYT